jgi:hypothetical protein
MPYLPEPCFHLIKAYAGIHPAKYHQKKIATMIDDSVEYFEDCLWGGHVDCPIPPIYKIIFWEEWLEKRLAYRGNAYDGPLLAEAHHLYDTVAGTIERLRINYSWQIYLISIDKMHNKSPPDLVWLKLTASVDPPGYVNSSHTTARDSCYDTTITELQEFCEVNEIPKSAYANLTKPEMISLILKYPFG